MVSEVKDHSDLNIGFLSNRPIIVPASSDVSRRQLLRARLPHRTLLRLHQIPLLRESLPECSWSFASCHLPKPSTICVRDLTLTLTPGTPGRNSTFSSTSMRVASLGTLWRSTYIVLNGQSWLGCEVSSIKVLSTTASKNNPRIPQNTRSTCL